MSLALVQTPRLLSGTQSAGPGTLSTCPAHCIQPPLSRETGQREGKRDRQTEREERTVAATLPLPSPHPLPQLCPTLMAPPNAVQGRVERSRWLTQGRGDGRPKVIWGHWGCDGSGEITSLWESNFLWVWPLTGLSLTQDVLCLCSDLDVYLLLSNQNQNQNQNPLLPCSKALGWWYEYNAGVPMQPRALGQEASSRLLLPDMCQQPEKRWRVRASGGRKIQTFHWQLNRVGTLYPPTWTAQTRLNTHVEERDSEIQVESFVPKKKVPHNNEQSPDRPTPHPFLMSHH